MKSSLTSVFETFIGIDYSGAGTADSRQAGIQVYRATGRTEPERIGPQVTQGKNWCRTELFAWLDHVISESGPIIIGMDHAFSFPISYFDRYQLKTWQQFLSDFAAHWPTDQPSAKVEMFRNGNKRTGTADEYRIADRWTPGAKSVFQFDVQGSVAKSTHAGLPFLHRLRQQHGKRIHFWPFDGWHPQAGKTVICEIFPTLFRNRYDREERTVDAQDAFSVCQWLKDMQRQRRLEEFFNPTLSAAQRKVAKLEGWILGVM